MEALVQLDGVTKRYDSGAAAVDEVSLQIAAAPPSYRLVTPLSCTSASIAGSPF